MPHFICGIFYFKINPTTKLYMIYQEASKERFILNNPKLSDEEKFEMLDFYKDHSNLDSIGIDWQKDWDFSDFKKVKDKYIKPIDETGLELGKDFLYFGEKDRSPFGSGHDDRRRFGKSR